MLPIGRIKVTAKRLKLDRRCYISAVMLTPKGGRLPPQSTGQVRLSEGGYTSLRVRNDATR